VFIIACLLIPIIGIGLYPKLVTSLYDQSTNALVALLRQELPQTGETVAQAPALYNN
jgi:NAD(P)H-quinone oxidoreductase subunit 4